MVLIGDLFSEKWLYEKKVSFYYKAWIRVSVECQGREVVLPPFTGKVVKSLLIKAYPGLEDVFTSTYNPKPIHVSPLYYNGQWLWKRWGREDRLSIPCNSIVGFHLGFTEDIAEKTYSAMENLFGVKLYDAEWSITEFNTEKYELPSTDPGISIDDHDKVIVYFNSPAILVDPYKANPSNPRYLPLAGVLFSYNIGDLLRMRSREFRWKPEYWIAIDIINATLHEHRRILDYVKTVVYNYDGKKGYGIGGKAIYYITRRIINEKKWIKKLVENILVHASIMGVGSSRANGFGHVKIVLK